MIAEFVERDAAFAFGTAVVVVGAAGRGLVPTFDDGENSFGVDLAGALGVILERGVEDEVGMRKVGRLCKERHREE